MKQIRLLAQYYVDLDDEVRSGALLNVAGAGPGRFADCGTNGGNHGAAWSGRKH